MARVSENELAGILHLGGSKNDLTERILHPEKAGVLRVRVLRRASRVRVSMGVLRARVMGQATMSTKPEMRRSAPPRWDRG
jgi:hypothetical protein